MDKVDQKRLIKVTVEIEGNFIDVSNEAREMVEEITGIDSLANHGF
jgi:hypothetical protein